MADSVEYPDLVIVGAGLFGLTVAQQAVEHTGARVRIGVGKDQFSPEE